MEVEFLYSRTNYDTAIDITQGKFTAPIAGIYEFNWHLIAVIKIFLQMFYIIPVFFYVSIYFLCKSLISETWPVQNENTSIQYSVCFSNTEVSVSVFNLKNTGHVSVSVCQKN